LRTGLTAHRLTRERRGLRAGLLTGRTERCGLHLTRAALRALLAQALRQLRESSGSTGRTWCAGALLPSGRLVARQHRLRRQRCTTGALGRLIAAHH
jgi:hypothetical protein